MFVHVLCFMEVSTPCLGYEQGHHYKLVPLDSVLQLWVDAGADVPVPAALQTFIGAQSKFGAPPA